MSQEIELKLTISKASIEQFLSLDLLAGAPPDVFLLENTYFDTPDRQLTKAGAALRLRKTPTAIYQTLKTKGHNIGGLHRRDEWEMEVPSEHLDFTRFPAGAVPQGLTLDQLEPLFQTNFERSRWVIRFNTSQVELVLDVGKVEAGFDEDLISELELELKAGNLADLLELSLQISKKVAVMPSDISKAERGYRLCNKFDGVDVALPDIIPQQSMDSAFCALFGYEMERLQRYWQVFWSTQKWVHLQAFLTTLGNMEAEVEWFQSMLPSTEIQMAKAHLNWIAEEIRPILSWWPACFALSKDVEEEPESVALSLQRAKALKALNALRLLREKPELGFRMLSLTAWLHNRSWQSAQSEDQRTAGEQAVVEGLDYCFGKAFSDIQEDCFAGSTSHALSQSPAVHRLLILCNYFDRLYGKELGLLRDPLNALEENLSRLSAMEVVTRLKDWLTDLPLEQQASIHSWTRSQTVLLRDIKGLANKLMRRRALINGSCF